MSDRLFWTLVIAILFFGLGASSLAGGIGLRLALLTGVGYSLFAVLIWSYVWRTRRTDRSGWDQPSSARGRRCLRSPVLWLVLAASCYCFPRRRFATSTGAN